MVLIGISAWAGIATWESASFSGLSITNNSVKNNDVTWTLTASTVGAGAPEMAISGTGLKFGSSKSHFFSSYTISTDFFADKKVTKIEVNCRDNGGTESSVTATQGGVEIGTATTSSTTAATYTLQGGSNTSGTLSITYVSSKQSSYINSIKVYYDSPDAIDVTSISLDKTSLNLVNTETATLKATILPADASNKKVIWSSTDEDVVTVEDGYVRAVGCGDALIYAESEDGGYKVYCYVEVAGKMRPSNAAFYETFDYFSGMGGNDNKWSGSIGAKEVKLTDFENSGWTMEGTCNQGSQCISIRKGTDTDKKSIISGITSPKIGAGFEKGQIVFKAESWGSDGTNFFVDIIGEGTFVESESLLADNISNEGKTAKVIMKKEGVWTTFTLDVKDMNSNTQLRFYAPAGKRAFLDEVMVLDLDDEFIIPIEFGDYLSAQGSDGYYYGTHSYKSSTFVVADGVKVYQVMLDPGLYLTELPTKTVSIEEEGDVTGYIVPSNQGVLIQSDHDTYNCYSINHYYADNFVENSLYPSFVPMRESDTYVYLKLAYNDYEAKTGLGFYYGAEDGAPFTCKEGAAYFKCPKAILEMSARGDEAKFRGFPLFPEEATAIQSISAKSNPSAQLYNLNGQAVDNSYKGIVIKNGKKYLNK